MNGLKCKLEEDLVKDVIRIYFYYDSPTGRKYPMPTGFNTWGSSAKESYIGLSPEAFDALKEAILGKSITFNQVISGDLDHIKDLNRIIDKLIEARSNVPLF